MHEAPLRRLRIDLDELDTAFENTSAEMEWYLDVETGEVLLISEEVHAGLARIIDEHTGMPDIARLDELSDLPDWEQEMVAIAARVRAGSSERYMLVPGADAREDYRDMEAFIDGVAGARLQQRLWDAINGRHPFRRFKDVLFDAPAERARWFAFSAAARRRRVLVWLAALRIEPIEGAEPE